CDSPRPPHFSFLISHFPMPVIPLIDEPDSEELRELYERLSQNLPEIGGLNIFKVMAHTPQLLRGWLRMAPPLLAGALPFPARRPRAARPQLLRPALQPARPRPRPPRSPRRRRPRSHPPRGLARVALTRHCPAFPLPASD